MRDSNQDLKVSDISITIPDISTTPGVCSTQKKLYPMKNDNESRHNIVSISLELCKIFFLYCYCYNMLLLL